MARKQQKPEDDLLMDDELATAFLDDADASMSQQPAQDDDWDEEDNLPGQLAVDLYETRERLIVKARVAGVNKNDLDVSISDNELTIRGTLTSGDEVQAENYYMQECYWGEFSRILQLPTPVKEDEVEAVLKDGVLTISFTKLKQDTVKKIEIQ